MNKELKTVMEKIVTQIKDISAMDREELLEKVNLFFKDNPDITVLGTKFFEKAVSSGHSECPDGSSMRIPVAQITYNIKEKKLSKIKHRFDPPEKLMFCEKCGLAINLNDRRWLSTAEYNTCPNCKNVIYVRIDWEWSGRRRLLE